MMNVTRTRFGKKLPSAWACSFFRKAAVPVLASLSLASPSPAFAQTTTPTSRPPACATADHRAFDFWIGTWDVTAAGRDEPTAVNKITREHGGCVLREDYATKGGYTGMSISFYDAARKIWHQTWMGLDGGALFIEGRFE